MKENNLYNIILSENFGILESITNFNKKLSSLSYFDKIIETLIHRNKITKDIIIYREIEKLILKHVNSNSFSLLKKPKHNINDPITNYTYQEILDVLFTKCSNVLIHYDLEIDEIITNSIIFISNKYSLSNEEIDINLNNERLSIMLPLLIDFKKWKKGVLRLLSNENNIDNRSLKKNEILGLLVELNEKLEGKLYKLFLLVTNFNDCKDYPKDNIFETRLANCFERILDYNKIQIDEYISFVKNIDLNKLKQFAKLKISNNYKQSELLKILDNFKEECSFIEFNTYDFIYYYTTCVKKVNLDLEYKNNRIKNISLYSKEHRANLLSLIKYLNFKKILDSPDKRTYGPIIQEYYFTKKSNSTTTIYKEYNKCSLPMHSISYLEGMIDQV